MMPTWPARFWIGSDTISRGRGICMLTELPPIAPYPRQVVSLSWPRKGETLF